MKNFLFLLLTATLWPALRVEAEDEEPLTYELTTNSDGGYSDDNNVEYSLKDGTASVMVQGYIISGDIVIPEKVKYGSAVYTVTSVQKRAFINQTAITSISLPSTITSLGDYCFYNCTSLLSADLSSTSITSLPTYCFYGCSVLETINLSNCISLASLENYSVRNCTSLKSIDLSGCSELTSLGDYCFCNCTSLLSVDLSSTSITSLPSYCFWNCTSLASVTLPEEITSIPNYCFWNCTSLASINLPSTITKLGISCFRSCSNFPSIDLSGCTNFESLGDSCFKYCSNLTTIDLPATSITSLPSGCFYGCTLLKTINLSSCTSLTSLGNYCFYECSSLYAIDLPDGITSLGNYCFYECSSLYAIDLPDGITSLGDYCFYGCSAQESVDLSNCSGLTSLPVSCFYGCSSLTSFSLPSSITSLGKSCFSGCKALEKIDLSSYTNLTSLPSFCFYGCASLTEIILNEGITSLESGCFVNCPNLTLLDLSYCTSLTSLSKYFFANDYGSNSLEIRLPTSITSLGSSCFENSYRLKSIDLSNTSITSLGQSCFYRCQSLASIKLPSTLKSLGEDCFRSCSSLTAIDMSDCTSLTSLPKMCFYCCTSLSSIAWPDGIMTLGMGCFMECYSLVTIDLPRSITELGEQCFAGSGLTSIYLHNGITSLPYGCFLYCLDLTSIDLPKGITSLGGYCFSGCINLTAIDLPISITSVGDNCFSACENLNKIASGWYDVDNVTIGSDVFSEGEYYVMTVENYERDGSKVYETVATACTAEGVPSTCTLYVPIGMKENYQATDTWSYFSTIEETDEVTNFHIKNPGFEYGNSRAWAYAGVEDESISGDAGVKAVSSTDEDGNTIDSDYATEGSVDDYLFYALYDDDTQTEDLHQMIKLPAGNYILSAKVAYDHSDETSTATDFAQIYINDSEGTEIGHTNVDAHEGNFVESAVQFTVDADDTFVTIGIRRNAPWLKVDDIHLYYYKDDAEYTVSDSETTSFAKKYDAVANNKNVSVSIAAGKFAGRIFPFRPVSIMEESPETNTADTDRTGIYNNVTVYACGGFNDDGSALTLTEVTDLSTLEANVPYFFYNNTEEAISVTLCDAAAAPIYESYSAGNGTLSLTGVHAQTKVEKPTSGTNYVLQTKDGEQKLYPVGDSGVNISAYRTYLTDASSNASAKALSLSFEDDSATAIEAIEAVEALTSDNAEIYDLSGRKLSKLQKGINIVNGHKIMVK